MPLNPNLTANEYYNGSMYADHSRLGILSQKDAHDERRAYSILLFLVESNQGEELKNSAELKKYGVNHRYGSKAETLLHAAYRASQPEIIALLHSLGADERIANISGELPMELARSEYKDDLPRVVNVIANRYLEALKAETHNPALLFNETVRFIKEKNWRYFNKRFTDSSPFRDRPNVHMLGRPDLSYNVNCYDLVELVVRVAKQVGMQAKRVYYPQKFQSIARADMVKADVHGLLEMFDGSKNCEEGISFGSHCVAAVQGWHLDPTLQCMYVDRNAILKSVPPPYDPTGFSSFRFGISCADTLSEFASGL